MLPQIREIGLKNPEYPPLLKETPHAPEKFWLWGKIPQKTRYLSIVGTRRCSAYGKEITEKLVAGLAAYDFAIVSGLALGIDTAAHEASLTYGVPTIAVIGSGLSERTLFPRQNLKLAKNIVASGGGIISEYPHDMLATLWSFPQRNRIVAGMCHATLVVEAPEKSGALITARLALDYNRDVLAVPGGAFSHNSHGTNILIKNGAGLVTTSEDILHAFGIETEAAPTSTENFTPEETIIMACLLEPLDIDSLIRKSKMPSSIAQTTIGLLELRGIIKKVGTEYIKNV